jgi:hypothetical protein
LVPAGAYFADIAAKLEAMNARDAARREELHAVDRALEAMYGRGSASTVKARVQGELRA